MEPYNVIITETLEKIVRVRASSREDAELRVEQNWKKNKYVLDSGHFTGVEFQAECPQHSRG